MSEPDFEQIAQEDALFPWLASDCMADPGEPDLLYWGEDEYELEEDEYGLVGTKIWATMMTAFEEDE